MCKDTTLYCCEVIDMSGNTNIAEEFFSVKGYDFSSIFDYETKEQRHILYFQDQDSADSAIGELKNIGSVWHDMGVRLSEPTRFSIEKKDWSEVWKKYFKIQHVSDRVVIKPTWLEYNQKDENEVIIELDPGMSFGTGRHATTRFCIKMLDKLVRQAGLEKSVIDAGCGSGILSIAAYKLGFREISAFDNDPGCIITTTENLELNKIDPSEIILEERGLQNADTSKQYDIVIANIMAHILVENRDILKTLMCKNGHLILAGILTEEYCEVRSKFEELGLTEVNSITEDEWTGGMFV
jgi:ribosomal protein L11 methyltransferase